MNGIVKRALQTVAIGGFAFIAGGFMASPASAVMSASCNQRLIYCVENAAATFDCCMYQADGSTQGTLCQLREALTQNPKQTVTACAQTLNWSINSCDQSWSVCKLTNPK